MWVTPDADAPAESVADWLGDEIDELLGELGLGEMVHHAVTEYDLDCNWKLLTDGFLEIYHLKYLHRRSIAPYFPANLMATAGSGTTSSGGSRRTGSSPNSPRRHVTTGRSSHI